MPPNSASMHSPQPMHFSVQVACSSRMPMNCVSRGLRAYLDAGRAGDAALGIDLGHLSRDVELGPRKHGGGSSGRPCMAPNRRDEDRFGARSGCRSRGRMSTLEAKGITMGLPAKTDDREVDELRGRLAALPIARQARVLEGVLTPGLRLRVLADQVRRQVGSLSDEEEAEAERKIDEAVKEARRSSTRAG